MYGENGSDSQHRYDHVGIRQSLTILAWRFKSRPRSRATLINSHNSAKILIRILYNFWFWKSIKSVLCDTDIALFRATTQLENYTLHICFPHEPVSVMRTVHYSMHACISSVGYAHNTVRGSPTYPSSKLFWWTPVPIVFSHC